MKSDFSNKTDADIPPVYLQYCCIFYCILQLCSIYLFVWFAQKPENSTYCGIGGFAAVPVQNGIIIEA
jgi:hypothetical protein